MSHQKRRRWGNQLIPKSHPYPPTISIECTTQTPGTTSIQDTVDATEECSTKNVEASSMTVTSSD